MPAHSVSDLDSFIKSSAERLVTMRQQDKSQKEPGGCSLPISPCLSIFTPSPYILNCKRRAWESRDALSAVWGTSIRDALKFKDQTENPNVEKIVAEDKRLSSASDHLMELRDALETFVSDTCKGEGIDVEVLQKKSVRGKILAEILSSRRVCSMKPEDDQAEKPNDGKEQVDGEEFCSPSGSTSEDEFFDAREAASSDGYSSSEEVLSRRTWKQNEPRHQLQLEVKRRMKAEEALQRVQVCQERIVKLLLSTSFSRSNSPQPASLDDGLASLVDEDWQDEDSIIAAVISSALLRGTVKPDEAESLKRLLETRDRESSRLRRKLKFYEHVNHELSRKNQEATEQARRTRKRRQKWLNICARVLVAGVAVGVSGTFFYWYFPWERFKPSRTQSSSNSSSNIIKDQQAQ